MGLIGLLIAIWLIYALRSIHEEVTRVNASLERMLALMEGKEPAPAGDSPEKSPGLNQLEEVELPIYQEPNLNSRIIARAPKSWDIDFGEEQDGWFPVEIVGDAPLSVLRLRGWVRQEDLNEAY
ncbi:MAG: hypothetical protein ACYC9O_01735 [Candidatus Latescibacterota bacterium]